jgi:hypothetical protein
MEEKSIGPASDVFSLAATTFSILTGEEMFSGDNVMKILEQARSRHRRSIASSRTLCDELRARPSAVNAIDAAIALGTAPDSRDRPQSAGIFGAMVTSALRSDGTLHPPPSRRRLSERLALRSSASWNWKIRHAPGDDRAIRSVAWDASGSCLAATTVGLAYWNGTDWAEVALERNLAESVRSVHHVSPGLFLIGGERALFAYYAVLEGLQRPRRPRTTATFEIEGSRRSCDCRVDDPRRAHALCHVGCVGFACRFRSCVHLRLCALRRGALDRRRPQARGAPRHYSPLRQEVQQLGPSVRTFTSGRGRRSRRGVVVGAPA